MSLTDIAVMAANLEPTKRSIVSLVGKFYDPLGFLSPVVISFKIFLQELCVARLDWDGPLTGALLAEWRRLLRSLNDHCQVIRIPRCYASPVLGQPVIYEVCGFCDTSLKAYAAVVYVLSESGTGC